MDKITEIAAIRLEKLNNDEFAQFLKSTINLIEDTTLEKLNIKQEWITSLKKHTDDLTEASRQSRYSAETQNIKSLDKQRGRLVVFILSAFRNERHHIDENRRIAATHLYKVTKNFSGIQGLPFRQKSQSISALVKDLKKSSEVGNVETLGLTGIVQSLEEKNQECQNLIESRAETQISEVKISTKQVRLEATKVYKGLMKYAFATNLLHPTTKTENFINLQNKLVTDTMFANKQRLSLVVKKEPKQVG